METTILKLSKQPDRQPLLKYVAERSEEEIVKAVDSCLSRNRTAEDVDPLFVLRGLLLGLPPSRDEICMQKRATVIKEVVKWLCEGHGDASNSKLASSVVTYLLPELESLSKEYLSDVANQILGCLEDGKELQSRVFEILSKIWNLLVAAQKTEYTGAIFQKIKTSQWSPQSALGIAAGINDMELAGQQLEQITRKLISELETLDIDELPPYIYQLLLLSRKGQKRTILLGICEHFNKAESKRSKNDDLNTSYVRMEGTVMLHITFAIKQDQELGNELLKMMRQGKAHALQTFPIATLLSAARIHRLEDMIFDILKSTITTIFRDNEKLKQFTWMPEYAKVDAAYIEETCLSIAEKSAAGWDQLTQPLAQLAVLLIESTVNQTSWLKSKASKTTQQKSLPTDGVIVLGIKILLRLFQRHNSLRSEILDQITSRIISRSESAPEFISLLETLVSDQPRAIEPYLSNIRDTLNYLSYLPYPTADSLLRTVQPLGNIEDSFRDGLILVLRKCMFAKDVDGRKVAVNGFLDLLRNQSSSEGQAKSSSSTIRNAGVAFEILGLLRRCLTQQGEIRTLAYEGLQDVSCCDVLIADIFEILFNQFNAVYETDTSIPVALRLEACVENANTARCPILVEPAHVLLSNLFKVVRRLGKIDQNPVIAKALTSCQEAASSLIFRLSKADLEDYELDKTASYDKATYAGVKNNLYASVLLGCYEVAIEHEFYCRGSEYESFETIAKLFKKRCALLEVLKEVSTDERGRKLAVDYPTMLSLDFTAAIIEKMFVEGDRQTPMRAVRADLNFIQYVVNATQQCLENAISRKRHPSENEAIFNQCVKLCKVYKQILLREGSDSSFVNHQPKKGTSLLGAIIDSMRTILDTVAKVWPEKLDGFLVTVFPKDNNAHKLSHNCALLSAFEFFKKTLLRYINDPPPLYKEAASVIQVLALLASNLTRDAEDFTESIEEIRQWLENFVKERPLEEIGLVKELITLFIKMCTQADDFLTVTYLAQDLHALHGDIEVPADSQEDQDEELSVQYQMMNEKTCGPVTLLLLSSLDHWLDDLNWAIGRLKQYASDVTGDEDDSVTEFEKLVCKRVQSCLNVLSEFTKAVLLGPHAEALIRVLSKTYKLLLALVKYTMTRPQQMTSEFVLVVQIAGTNITDKMYKFLTIYGQQHMDYLEAGLKKGKGKKAGATSKEKAKILRESKTIPNLIFLVEQFERHLIQLTRKSKVDLMQYMKRSTARDFKIKLDLIQDAEHMEDDTENEKSRIATNDTSQNKRTSPDEEEDGMDVDISDSTNENPNKRKRQRNR